MGRQIIIRYYKYAVVLIFILFTADVSTDYIRVFANTKVYRVAILPICNPGTSCEPKLPKALGRKFFKQKNGVAVTLYEASENRTLIKGVTTSWLRPKNKLKSIQHVLDQTESLIELAKDQIVLSDFDIFYIYTNVISSISATGWPKGQILNIDNKDLNPAIVFILDPHINNQKKSHHTVLPSEDWRHEFLYVSGIDHMLLREKK